MARSVGVDRAQVIAAAAVLADTHGLEQLTLAQVAAQVGIRLPSLYNHVDGLAGLRRELALLGVRELGEWMTQATIGKAGDEAVYALAQAYRTYATSHPGRYAAGIRAAPADDAELAELGARVVTIVVAVLHSYGLHNDDAIHAVRGLRSIVHGFATLESAGGFGIPLDVDESFRRLVAGYIVGLRADLE